MLVTTAERQLPAYRRRGDHPCMINGKDWGQLLYTLGVLGWLMLVTVPVGALAFAVWLVVLLLHRVTWRKQSAPWAEL